MKKDSFLPISSPLFLPLLLFILLSGCIPEKKSKDSTLKIRESAEPASINPFFIKDEVGYYLASQIFQPLLAVDYRSEELVGVLAESKPTISSSDQWAMIFDFQLRKNIKFSNDSQMTAQDVYFSLKANLSPILNPYYYSYYTFVDSFAIDPKDPLKFKIYSKESYYLSEYTSGDYFIISENQFDPKQVLRKYSIKELKTIEEGSKNAEELTELAKGFRSLTFRDGLPIGSGPYQLNEWSDGRKIELTKEKNWYGENYRASNIYFEAESQKLSFYFIEDEQTALNALKNQEFDLMRGLPPKEFNKLENDAAFSKNHELLKTQKLAIMYLGFNLRDSSLSDLNLRKAIAFALPKEQIIEIVFYNMAEPASSLIENQSEKSPDSYQLDSAKYYANRYFSKTSADRIELTYTYNAGNEKRKAIGLILKQSLKELGIDLKVETYEWSVYLQKLKGGELDIFFNGVSSSVLDPDYSNTFHSDAIEGGRNYFGYQDQKSDSLLEAIRLSMDDEKRKALLYSLDQRLSQQVPLVVLMRPLENLVFSNKIENPKAYRLRPNYWAAELKLR